MEMNNVQNNAQPNVYMLPPHEAEKLALLREMNANVAKIKKHTTFFFVLALIGVILCGLGAVGAGIYALVELVF